MVMEARLSWRQGEGGEAVEASAKLGLADARVRAKAGTKAGSKARARTIASSA